MDAPTAAPRHDPPASTWRRVVGILAFGIDHDRIATEINDGGALSGRFVMMSVLSAAIAILGLLLSSPAVVIGAMLLSPLMGPIILLGLSFWMVDWPATRRAVLSLAVGLGLSLAVAVVLTWVSPLKEPTAEILARTRPNLFDLLVAVFSGLAGGYAVIRQRGEAVIGVAIATALMPPIATVGFGLGTGAWAIAMGALLLFATNLIAIALAAAGMAALYGFRPHALVAKRGWLGQGAVVLVVIGLCVPLTLTLNTIGLESRATVMVRHEVGALFGRKARLTSLSVRSTPGGLEVAGLVATPVFVDEVSQKLAQRLKSDLGTVVAVDLDQVVLADPSKLKPIEAAKSVTTATPLDELRAAVAFPVRSISFDAQSQQGVVLLARTANLDIGAAQALEAGLRARGGLERTVVIPPVEALPSVGIHLDDRDDATFDAGFGAQAWALQRWGVTSVTATICGLRAHKQAAAVGTAVAAALKPMQVTMRSGSTANCPPGVGASVLIAPR
ncbi:DUF389 domain-containing protein [Caulobacter sp. KR2-114]|uniref:DUF389 domain-containing protein n=1 Tax=Caulobacter sp. KR2-114 TaxID=3400912 RepID=UPI003C04BD83